MTVVAAFLLFEPRRPQEYLGWSVQALAVLGFAVLAHGGVALGETRGGHPAADAGVARRS